MLAMKLANHSIDDRAISSAAREQGDDISRLNIGALLNDRLLMTLVYSVLAFSRGQSHFTQLSHPSIAFA